MANSFSIDLSANSFAITTDDPQHAITINGVPAAAFNYVPANKAGDTFLGNVYVNSASLAVNSGNLTVNGGSVVVSGNMTLGSANIGGNLTVDGQIGCGAFAGAFPGDITAARGGGGTGVLYVGNNGGSTYLYFDGTNYQLGGWGVIATQAWMNGTFYTSFRFVFAGDIIPGGTGGPYEISAAMTDGIYLSYNSSFGVGPFVNGCRNRYLQIELAGGWYTVGWAS